MGQAIARRLHAEGCVLTVTGRRADLLEGLAGELGARGVVADLAQADGVQRVLDASGDVDILIAAAGVAGGGELTGYDPDQVDRVLDINLRVPIALARVLGERMLGRGHGHLVFISSLSGKTAGPASSLYSATKFGLRGFALALRQDWGARGVGVSCVNPGPIGDAATLHHGEAQPAGFRPRVPADVAAAVVKAIRSDRAEVDVADPVMRAGVVLSQLAPQAAAKFSRLADGEKR